MINQLPLKQQVKKQLLYLMILKIHIRMIQEQQDKSKVRKHFLN